MTHDMNEAFLSRHLSRHLARHLRSALLVLLLAVIALPASAQRTRNKDQSQERTKQTVAMSAKVGAKVQEAQLLIEAKDYVGGNRVLDNLRTGNLSPYERAQTWNLTAYAEYSQERYPQAIRAYEQLLSQGSELPPALIQSTLKTVSQLYLIQENYPAALRTAQQLMSMVAEPSSELYMVVGQAYYQMDQYRNAVDPMKKGIELYKQQGKTPRENWLLLIQSCYFQLQDYNKLIPAVKELISYYPDDKYLLTLAGAYSELGETKKQLAITEVLYERNFLNSSSHITNLANLFMMHETPYKAAKLLEKEMGSGRVDRTERNLRLLSQAWYSAREDEKSIPPLQQAARMSSDGELYIRVAQSLLNLERWEEAASSIREGLSRGGIKRSDQANIMLGMALFNQQQLQNAKVAFQNARGDQRSRKAADQWIKYVDTEVARKKTLEQELPQIRQREIDEMLKSTPTG